MIWLWTGFFAAMVGMVLLDLYVLRPARRRVTPVASVWHGALWLVAAMVFNVIVFFIYERNAFEAGLRDSYTEALGGGEASLQFLSSFIIELALGVESMFLVAMLFPQMGLSAQRQHRVLMWGVIPAMVVRALLILGAGSLLHEYEWCRFILAALLVIAAMRMVLVRRENTDPDKNLLVRMLRCLVPISRASAGTSLVTTVGGRPAFTWLVLPLLLVETGDAFLALDSIPASFAFTKEPFLIFAACGFALMCVRSMAPALTLMLGRLRYFKLGLAMLLMFSAVLLFLPIRWVWETINPSAPLGAVEKLGFIAAALAVGVLAAWIAGPGSQDQPVPSISPLGEDADRLARRTLGNVRKVIIATLGFAGLIAGGAMAIGPGPGLPVVFVSLLLLASEFVWARTLLNRYRKRAEEATVRAARETRRRFRPWALLLIMGGTIAAALAIGHYFKINLGLVIGGLVPMLAGQAYIAYLAYVKKDLHDAAAPRTDASSDSERKKRSA